MFNIIENLRTVPRQEGQPPPPTTKTLFVPLPNIVHVTKLGEQEQSLKQVLELYFQRDLETVLCTRDRVRMELVEEVYLRLLASHPLYSDLHQPTVMASIRDELEFMVIRGLVSEEDSSAKDRVFSVLMPDRPDLNHEQRQIIEVTSLDSKLAAVFDPRGEAGVVQEGREVPITPQQWSQHRLAHARRDGPMNHPGLVLALALQHTTQRIHSASGLGQAGLVNRVGTSSYYQGLRAKIETLGRWEGPVTFSISCSFDPYSEIMLATWMSHTAGVEGRQEQIWHRGSGQQLLTLRPGRQLEENGLQGFYFVHCVSEEQDDSCPFHPYCFRQPVKEWRNR